MSNTKSAPVKPTVTRFGRKYLVVHSTVARVDDKNVVVQLLKRPNKPHFFVVEGKASPTNKQDFWSALEAYSVRQDALGINPLEALPKEELDEFLGLDEAEQKALCSRVQVVGAVTGRVSMSTPNLQRGPVGAV